MVKFIKNNILRIGLAILAFVLVLILFLLKPESPGYMLGQNASLQLISDPGNLVLPDNLEGKQLIDIRSPELFRKGHPEQAINIPVRQLLDKASIELFNELRKNRQMAVMYGSHEREAAAPWLLMQQLGYSNLQLLKGGADEHGILFRTSPEKSETCTIDTAAFHARTTTPDPVLTGSARKSPEKIVPVRTAPAAGGGC